MSDFQWRFLSVEVRFIFDMEMYRFDTSLYGRIGGGQTVAVKVEFDFSETETTNKGKSKKSDFYRPISAYTS